MEKYLLSTVVAPSFSSATINQQEFDELLEALDAILKCANVRIDDPRCGRFDHARAVVKRARARHAARGVSRGDCEHANLQRDNYALYCLDCGAVLDDA